VWGLAPRVCPTRTITFCIFAALFHLSAVLQGYFCCLLLSFHRTWLSTCHLALGLRLDQFRSYPTLGFVQLPWDFTLWLKCLIVASSWSDCFFVPWPWQPALFCMPKRSVTCLLVDHVACSCRPIMSSEACVVSTWFSGLYKPTGCVTCGFNSNSPSSYHHRQSSTCLPPFFLFTPP